MEKWKDLIKEHKKAVIIVSIIILLLIAGIITWFAVKSLSKSQNKALQTNQQSSALSAIGEEAGSSDTAMPEENSDVTESLSSYREPVSSEHTSSQTPASSNKSSEISSVSTTISSSGNTGAESPAHQHTWVNHTTQEWVSNIVTVIDKPEQTISGARFYTMSEPGKYIANGPTYWFENGFTKDDLKEIIKNGLLHADENGLYNGVYYGNYQNVTKTIPAVTHEEDKGHYEDITDYQYCSVCGQRR